MARETGSASLANMATACQWSGLEETPNHMEKLFLLCHSQRELKLSGYIVEPLSSAQLRSKRRCEKCGARTNFRPNKAIQKAGKERPKPKKTTKAQPQHQDDARKMVCTFHTGAVYNMHFSCCQQHVSTPGCIGEEKHSFPEETAMAPVQQYWQYHSTPSAPAKPSVNLEREPCLRSVTKAHRDFLGRKQAARAIALDCEMGRAVSGDSELIRITAIDLFSQEILVDQLVQPSVQMKHYNTRYSGIRAVDIRNAVRQRKCFLGRDAARNQLFKFISPETIVVMHAGHNDLTAIRWIHPLVVDTLILASYGAKTEGGSSLKNLCSRLLDVSIQDGRNGHDSLEDAAACRELAHRWVQSIPD